MWGDGVYQLDVENYKVKSASTPSDYQASLFEWLLRTTNLGVEATAVSELEKAGVSYEAAIEYCIGELEDNTEILERVMWWHYNIQLGIIERRRFSKSVAGRKIADYIIQDMRRCNNWKDLTETMKKSDSYRHIRNQIMGAQQ